MIALGAGIAATTAFAQGEADKARADAVSARHAQMQMVGYHTGVLGGIAKGEVAYDSAVVDAAAQNLVALSGMKHATLWIADTEQGAVEGSRAKPEIWTDRAGFEAKFEDLSTAAQSLVGAADAAAVGAGMAALGESCKACHETYRGPRT
jgi:cytochrome c556